jgi:2-oxoglutarate ferredoxin oxidoreductase subunit alpha
MARELWKGNEAIAEAAIRAGMQAYFGYPITPQTELLEYLARRMPELGRVFVQAESEPAAINMVYGAACTGTRVMISSSGPGISLMQEGLSYIAGTEVPMVLVDVMRGGPGLGNIAPSQGDYNQIVHGGGHGDYYPIVLAPAGVQEAIDMTIEAFDLAEKYRSIAVVLADGSIGQMMEPVEFPVLRTVHRETAEWAVSGAEGRERRVLTSIHMDPPQQEQLNLKLARRWQEISRNEVRYRGYHLEDARYAVVAFGTAGRVSLSAVNALRAKGLPVGLLRPTILSPFPDQAIHDLAKRVESILVVEMNGGQMLDDVLRAVAGAAPVSFYGRMGGTMPFPEEVQEELERMVSEPAPVENNPRERWLSHVAAMN